MIYDFYNGYQIDATDIDCGKVIYVDCYGMHMYKSVCELFTECDFTWPEINRCRMIPGINTNQPGIPNATPGYILTVNATGTCVQRTDPHTIFPGYVDEKVKASASDPLAGFLAAKFISSDLSVLINLIAGGSILDLTVNLPAFQTFPDPTSACANSSFLMAKGGVWALECDHSDLYVTRYLPADTTFTIAANTVAYPLINGFVAQGNSAMVIDGGSPVVNGIKITESGMYYVWMNVGVKIDPSVNAIRFMVWSTNTGDTPNKKLLLNSKRAVRPTGTPIVNTGRGETFAGGSMSEHGLVWLNSGDILTMVCRVDSDNLPAGSIVVEGQGIIEGVWGTTGQVATTYCGTLFGVARYPGKRRGGANPVL